MIGMKLHHSVLLLLAACSHGAALSDTVRVERGKYQIAGDSIFFRSRNVIGSRTFIDLSSDDVSGEISIERMELMRIKIGGKEVRFQRQPAKSDKQVGDSPSQAV